LFGEIDVRCHLVPHAAEGDFTLAFADDYVREACALSATMRSRVLVIVVPPPPCEEPPYRSGYPVRGTFDERIQMFRRLRTALADAVEESDGPMRAFLVDATDLLSDRTGGLGAEFTDDNHHANRQGAERIRDLVRNSRQSWV
jgi:lysophospholipase L1-like esterase